MTPQIPAQGILLHHDYGDTKSYHIACECGCQTSDHDLWIESDIGGVTVNVYATLKTDYWTESIKPRYDIDIPILQSFDWFWKSIWNGLATRLRLTRDIWIHGCVKHEASLIMTEQQALNYGGSLLKSVDDVKEFRKNHK